MRNLSRGWSTENHRITRRCLSNLMVQRTSQGNSPQVQRGSRLVFGLGLLCRDRCRLRPLGRLAPLEIDPQRLGETLLAGAIEFR